MSELKGYDSKRGERLKLKDREIWKEKYFTSVYFFLDNTQLQNKDRKKLMDCI